jgi:hypothetical protein
MAESGLKYRTDVADFARALRKLAHNRMFPNNQTESNVVIMSNKMGTEF